MDNKAKDRLAVKTATANVDKRKAEITNSSVTLTGRGTGGGVALNMSLTLTSTAASDSILAPRQVQLVIAYLEHLGGTATVQDLNNFAEKCEGVYAWNTSSGSPYEQTPQKIMAKYMRQMKGLDAWSKSKGNKPLVS